MFEISRIHRLVIGAAAAELALESVGATLGVRRWPHLWWAHLLIGVSALYFVARPNRLLSSLDGISEIKWSGDALFGGPGKTGLRWRPIPTLILCVATVYFERAFYLIFVHWTRGTLPDALGNPQFVLSMVASITFSVSLVALVVRYWIALPRPSGIVI
jgi:hypothetical protein